MPSSPEKHGHPEDSSGNESDKHRNKKTKGKEPIKPLDLKTIQRGHAETVASTSHAKPQSDIVSTADNPSHHDIPQGTSGSGDDIYKHLQNELRKHLINTPRELDNESIKNLVERLTEQIVPVIKKSLQYLRSQDNAYTNDIEKNIENCNNELGDISEKYNHFEIEDQKYNKEQIKEIVKTIDTYQQEVLKLAKSALYVREQRKKTANEVLP